MKNLKKIIPMFIPAVVLSILLCVLIGFRHVKELDAEEKSAIDHFKKEKQFTLQQVLGEQDYNLLSTTCDRLYQGVKYKVHGEQDGSKVENAFEEFKRAQNILEKNNCPQDHKNLLQALSEDLQEASNHYGTTSSYQILRDLSHYVFLKDKDSQIKEQVPGNTKTLLVLRKQGKQSI